MKDKFINIEKGDCISLFTYGFDRLYVVTQIVKELNSHKVILFNAGSNSHMYFPCKRVEMSYGWDLKDMINDFKKDFSIGIINCLCPKFNTKETIDFIKFLREDPDMKNKTFIPTIENLRFNGNVDDIAGWFDNVTGNEGSYQKLTLLLEEILEDEKKLIKAKWFKKLKISKIREKMRQVMDIIKEYENNCIYK